MGSESTNKVKIEPERNFAFTGRLKTRIMA